MNSFSQRNFKKFLGVGCLWFIFFAVFCFAEKVVLTRSKANFPAPEPAKSNLTLKLITPKGVETTPVSQFQNFPLFKDFKLPGSERGRKKQTLNILVLRVEFVADDDTFSTGNGKMDYIGFGKPEDGLFYDPPHTKKYFQRKMEFLRNYYKANSFGKCLINFTVKPDRPADNYQLPHKMSYYSGFDHYDPSTGFVWFNTYAMEMGMVRLVADAIAAADLDETIDFSDYDNIIVFHAGTLLQTSLYYHFFYNIPSATIPEAAFEYYLGVPYIIANNGTDTIQCAISLNSEMARVHNVMFGALGTVVHEFGHMLGLPDLYDVSGRSAGVGAWDLKGTGAWVGNYHIGAPPGSIPANLGAWSRYFFGHYTSEPVWVEPVVVTSPESLLSLRASAIDTQYSVANRTMIKVPISETEFFLIENRQQDIKHKDTIIIDVEDGVPVSVVDGEYDFFLPGSGILIWHIDDNVIYANYADNTLQIDPKHKGVDLEEADGIQHFDAWWYGDSLEYYGSGFDPFFIDDAGKSNYHFGPFTNPNSDSYYGKSLINIEIKSKPDTLMNLSLDFEIYQQGFPVTARRGHPIYSTSYGDLDNNRDMEVVVATKTGFVYVYNHDGSLYNSAATNQPITTFLAIGDVDGDSAEDILFGSNFHLRCLDGRTLNPLPNFPYKTGDIIVGAPLLFDINSDNTLEIIFGSKDRKLYCLNGQGENIANFPIYLNTWILSTPCIFDIDKKEIGVLGADGRFWIINQDGIVKEFTNSQHNMISYSSPVVGDIDRDGKPEAVIINGYGTVYIYGKDSLKEKFEIWIDTTFYFTPALADIDDDGFLEIIAPNSSKTLYVCNRNGTSENDFPLHTKEFINYPLFVADLDNDGKKEIVFGKAPADTLGMGQLKIINNRRKEFQFSPLFGDGGFSSPGAIFDLDLDGDMEIAAGTDSGRLYIWDFPIQRADWNGFMNSPKNWGRFEAELSPPRKITTGLLGTFYIYPSPVEKKGRVRFFLHEAAEVKIDILNIAGHKIGGMKLGNPTANEYNELEFDFSNRPNGVYLLRIEAKNKDRREVKFKKFAVLK